MLRVKMRSCVVIAKCGSRVAWWTPATTDRVSFVDFCAPARGAPATPTATATATATMVRVRKEAFRLMCRSSPRLLGRRRRTTRPSRELGPQGGHHLAREEGHVPGRQLVRHAAHLEDALDDAAARLLQDLAHAVPHGGRTPHHRVHP